MNPLLSFAQWVQSTLFFTELRGSSYVYPVILSLHMVAISLFGGLILVTDLRLLGLTMKTRSISEVVNQFRPLKKWGLILMVTCGILMACAKAEEYYYNAFFRMKLSVLLLVLIHAIVFRKAVYGNAEALDKSPTVPAIAKLAAGLSLVLWISLVIAGRGIGYIEPPLDKIHAEGRKPVPAARTAVTPVSFERRQ